MKLKSNKNVFLFAVIILFFSGCAQLQEVSKTIWGSSTRALDNARETAIFKEYNCTVSECFDVALSLGSKDESLETQAVKSYTILLKDLRKDVIVVIGVPGSVDTTEVGIFFVKLQSNSTRIEISSLSSYAKQKVAEALFKELDANF